MLVYGWLLASIGITTLHSPQDKSKCLHSLMSMIVYVHCRVRNYLKKPLKKLGLKVVIDRIDEGGNVITIIGDGIQSLARELDTFCAFYDDMDLAEIAAAKRFLHDRERFINRGYIDDW